LNGLAQKAKNRYLKTKISEIITIMMRV